MNDSGAPDQYRPNTHRPTADPHTDKLPFGMVIDDHGPRWVSEEYGVLNEELARRRKDKALKYHMDKRTTLAVEFKATRWRFRMNGQWNRA